MQLKPDEIDTAKKLLGYLNKAHFDGISCPEVVEIAQLLRWYASGIELSSKPKEAKKTGITKRGQSK